MASINTVVLLERDINGDSISPSEEAKMLARSGLHSASPQSCQLFYRLGKDWAYSCTVGSVQSDALPSTAALTLVVTSSMFDPERHAAMLSLLVNTYMVTGTPVKIAEGFLALFTTGKYAGESGDAFDVTQYDERAAAAAAPVGTLVQFLGLEFVLVWTAVLLKKRVAVLCEDVPTLLQCARAIPALAWYRQQWNILHPYVTCSEDELAELKACGFFVAGFTDVSIRGMPELYDVLVDLSGEASVIVSEHAKTFFGMTSVHKDVATATVALVESGGANQAVIKAVHAKTRDVLQKLRGLAGEGTVTQEVAAVARVFMTTFLDNEQALAATIPNAALLRFLFSLAQAEGLT